MDNFVETMNNTMYEMPDNARLWIYQASRPFIDEEVRAVKEKTAAFIREWSAHGQALKAAFSIEHNQFIVIAVDESFNIASGCSIDASVNLIRNLEQIFQVSLLDRSQVAFFKNERVVLHSLNELKTKFSSGELSGDTPVFNNLVYNIRDWKSSWKVPAANTWLKKYIN